MERQVEIRRVTEDAPVRTIHMLVLGICILTAIVDGMDNQAIGFSGPAIAADLNFPISELGVVFLAGTVGTLVGAVALGRLADWIGRRHALILCTVLFGALTLAAAFARNETELALLRFAGGLGLGGAMPCFLTLVSEYAPSRRKGLATSLLWCGYPLGGVVGGLVGAQLLSHDGWQSIFYAGGILALLVAILQAAFLPESLQFLVLKGAPPEKIARVVGRVAPGFDLTGVRFVADAAAGEKASVRDVFADGRGLPTILLWAPLLLTFMVTTFSVLWVPGLLKSGGVPIATTALLVALGNFATLPSQVAAGYLLDRIGPFRILPIAYGVLALNFAVMAFFLKDVFVLAAATVVGGLMQGPCIAGMLFLATNFYPSRVRSTGVGLAMGVGRSGQVVASLVIGALVARSVGVSTTILCMGLAPALALVCLLVLGLKLRGHSPIDGAGPRSPADNLLGAAGQD